MSAAMDLDAAPFAFLIGGEVAKHLPGQHDQSSHGSWAHGRTGWDGSPRTAKVEPVNGVAFAEMAYAAGVPVRIGLDEWVPLTYGTAATEESLVAQGMEPFRPISHWLDESVSPQGLVDSIVREAVNRQALMIVTGAINEGRVTNRDVVLALLPEYANVTLTFPERHRGKTYLEVADEADKEGPNGWGIRTVPAVTIRLSTVLEYTDSDKPRLAMGSDDPKFQWIERLARQGVESAMVVTDLSLPSSVDRVGAKRVAQEAVAARMSDVSLRDLAVLGLEGQQPAVGVERSQALSAALDAVDSPEVVRPRSTEKLWVFQRQDGSHTFRYGEFDDSWSSDGMNTGSVRSGRLTDPEFFAYVEDVARKEVVRDLIDSWSKTSNKTPLARGIQEAARVEFGLDAAASQDAAFSAAPMLGADFSRVARSFVRAQYEATQELLAKQFPGATHLVLYRGGDSNQRYSDIDTNDVWHPYDVAYGWAAATMNMRPLASFSSSSAGASIFATAGYVGSAPDAGKGVFAAAVPIERIFSTPFTGSGASIEAEFVILGGPIHGRKQVGKDTVTWLTPEGPITRPLAGGTEGAPTGFFQLKPSSIPPADVLPVGATEFITINGVVVPIGKHAEHDQSTHGNWATGTSEYRGQHTAPDRDSGAPASDLTSVYGLDVYGPNALRYFGYNGETEEYDPSKPDRVGSRMVNLDQQVLDMAARVRNNPGATVTVYRAVPLTAPNRLNRGDWVTPSVEYARDHGLGPLNGTFKLLEVTVTAGDLWNDGNSLLEWGWDSDAAEVPAALRKSTFRKHLAGSESDHDQSSHGSWASGSEENAEGRSESRRRTVHRVVDADSWVDVFYAVSEEHDVDLAGEYDESSEQTTVVSEFIANQLWEQAMAEVAADPEYADAEYDDKVDAAVRLQESWMEDNPYYDDPDYREVLGVSRLNQEGIKAFGQRVLSDAWDVSLDELVGIAAHLPSVRPPGSTYADIKAMAEAGDPNLVITFHRGGREFTVHDINDDTPRSDVVASGPLNDPAVTAALKDHAIYALVNVWSESSNKTLIARAIQRLAAEEFGVPDVGQAPRRGDPTAEAAFAQGSEALIEASGAPLRSFLRAQYEATQARLKLMFPGATHVRLYRGGDSTGRYGEGQSILDEEWEASREGAERRPRPVTLSLRPLASFGISTSFMSAGFFAAYNGSGSGATMFAADVPIERIFSTPLSGFGASQEGELVVLGGPIAGVALKEAISWRDRQVIDRADIPYGTTEFIMIDGQPVPIGKHLAGEHDQLSHGSWAQGRTGVPLDAVANRALDKAKLGKRVAVTSDDYRNPGVLGPVAPRAGQTNLLMKPEAIARIISEQGWDAPSARVTTEEFDELAKRDEFVVLYRGGPIGLSDGMEAGTPFIGDGYAGPGTYVTLRPERALEYAFSSAISPREILAGRVTDNKPRAAMVRMLVPKSFIERSTSDRRRFTSTLNSPLPALGSPIGWGYGMYTDDYVLYNTGAVILSPETPIFPEYALRDERDDYGNKVVPILKQDDLMEHGPYYAVVSGKAIPLDEYLKRIAKHAQHDQLSHGSWANGRTDGYNELVRLAGGTDQDIERRAFTGVYRNDLSWFPEEMKNDYGIDVTEDDAREFVEYLRTEAREPYARRGMTHIYVWRGGHGDGVDYDGPVSAVAATNINLRGASPSEASDYGDSLSYGGDETSLFRIPLEGVEMDAGYMVPGEILVNPDMLELVRTVSKHLRGQHDQLSHGSWAEGGGGHGNDGSSWSREGWSEVTAGGEEAVAKALKAKLDDILAVADEEDRRRFSVYTANKQLDTVDRIMDALFVAFEVDVTPEGRERIIRNLTYSRVFTKGESTLIVPPGWGTIEELVAEQQRVQGNLWSPLSSRMFGHLYDVTDAEIDSAMRMMERLQEVSPVSNAIVIITPTFHDAKWMGVTSAVSSAWAAERGLDTHIHLPVWQMAEMWSAPVHEAPSLPLTVQPFMDVSAVPWEWGMLFADNRRQVHLNSNGEPVSDVKMEQSRRIISINLPRIRSVASLSPEAFQRAAPGYPEAVRGRLLEWAVAHEWGHLVTTTTDRRRLFRFDDWFSGAVFRENESFNQLPQYSRSNADELWADTYAASLLAPELTQFRRIYEFGRDNAFLPVSTVVTPEFITIDGNIIPLEKAVNGLVYSGIICTFPEGPPQYIGDVEKHLAGKHDQSTHGRWAHGIPHAVGEELDIDRLREKGLLYRSSDMDALAERMRQLEEGQFNNLVMAEAILWSKTYKYRREVRFGNSADYASESSQRRLVRMGINRIMYLVEPEEGHPWYKMTEEAVHAQLSEMARAETASSAEAAAAYGWSGSMTYEAPLIRFLPHDVWVDAMAYSEMNALSEVVGEPSGEGPREFEGLRRGADTAPLSWLRYAAMDRNGPAEDGRFARYDKEYAQALWNNRERIVEYVRQYESYDRMEVFLDGYQRAREQGLEGKKAIEAGAALVARTGRAVSIDTASRVVQLADELTSLLPEPQVSRLEGERHAAREVSEIDSWRRMVNPTDEHRASTERFLSGARVAVAVPEESLEAILNDGALKNQYQSRTSNGLYKPTIRRILETAYLGVDVEAAAKDRPIYGYLFYPMDGKHAGEFIKNPSVNTVHEAESEQYGNIRIVLKPDVNERATFLAGDSLDEPFLAAPLSGERTERQSILSGSYLIGTGGYDEAQVHGGIKLNRDVERISVTSPEVMAAIRRAYQAERIGASEDEVTETMENAREAVREWRDVGFPAAKSRIEQMLRAAGYDLPVTHDLEFITLPDGRVIPLEDV